ncbi:hypothetical protein [Flammeovirga kamogawensis]|uniref:DUF4397 domain-containing protein n=1 Tax=Flammeovirga kamogawensis TaxID=373891 RepID=A0ABX8H2T6_9BACT|nr:hypothetical protein [Flammeovirga kamogawensis]MBB6463790.1 hypothetical protein [Flammeovirga kamogawensis]QWG09702.1 hypothetical protein KM029_24185 [Flammeovirga kamogawensis]TRX65213.1 hypothetical protein EO216_22075 [Flammeovirga kamogawensis]
MITNFTILRVISLFLVTLLFLGCNKDSLLDEEPIPEGNISLLINSVTSGNTPINSESFVLTDAILGIGGIKFNAENQLNNKYDFLGPYQSNIISGISNPDLGYTILPPNLYSSVSIDMSTNLEDSLSSKNMSIIANGKYFPNGVNVYHFVFKTDEIETINVVFDDILEVDSNTIYKLSIVFDFSIWFTNEDFSKADISDDKYILIDKVNNFDLYNKVIERIQNSAHLLKVKM